MLRLKDIIKSLGLVVCTFTLKSSIIDDWLVAWLGYSNVKVCHEKPHNISQLVLSL